MNIPVFDLHCDTILGVLGQNMMGENCLRKNGLHIDLERAAGLPGYAQCFACFTSPLETRADGISVTQVFERELDIFQREMERNQDIISQVYTAQDIRENMENGKMSAILTIEGPAGFDYDPALLEDLYKAGVRVSTLTWNERNPLAGSHKTGGGLTDQGREYVEEAQRLGMLIDVSHISDQAFWDIINVTRAPVIATHSNSRSVCGVSRNLTDEMFLAICHTGGVAGLNLCPAFLGEDPNIDTACDHVFHFLELDPAGSHIALGGDLDGISSLPGGFEGVQSYPALAARLLERGLDEHTIRKIFWDNALGVMDKCCM